VRKFRLLAVAVLLALVGAAETEAARPRCAARRAVRAPARITVLTIRRAETAAAVAIGALRETVQEVRTARPGCWGGRCGR
jgi:hypothetical protein